MKPSSDVVKKRQDARKIAKDQLDYWLYKTSDKDQTPGKTLSQYLHVLASLPDGHRRLRQAIIEIIEDSIMEAWLGCESVVDVVDTSDPSRVRIEVNHPELLVVVTDDGCGGTK